LPAAEHVHGHADFLHLWCFLRRVLVKLWFLLILICTSIILHLVLVVFLFSDLLSLGRLGHLALGPTRFSVFGTKVEEIRVVFLKVLVELWILLL
jgi:hypothetical protein